MILNALAGNAFPAFSARSAPTRAGDAFAFALKHLIHLTGTVESYITFCWSGPILKDIKWYLYIKGHCPQPSK